MSIQPQYADFGHQRHQYSSPPHLQPAHPGYGYSAPRQVQPMDPHTFRQFYSQQLAQLTVNSRPIIQNLSIIAQEYSRMAHVVAQCLETHTRLVQPQFKLTALYLLDAIAKNVYNPYASVFTENVTRIFIDAYETVDSATKLKMEEMMWTWRNSSPTRRELFGLVVQRHVENFVSSKHTSSSAPPLIQQPPTSNRITKGQVLTELDVTIAQKQLSLSTRPDEMTASQISTLKQLHTVVRSSDLSQDELGAILVQLRSLSNTPASIASSIPDPRASAFTATPVPAFIPPPIQNNPPSAVSTIPTAPISAGLRAFLNTIAPPSQTQQPAALPPQIPSNLSNVLSSIMSNGVPSLPPGINGALQQSPELQSAVTEGGALVKYKKSILSIRIKATSAEISKQPPHLVSFLYDRQAPQCKQCGLRIPQEDRGQQKMDDHLDMHYMQNSRNDKSAGRGHSRSWFVGYENWMPECKSKAQNEKERAVAAAQEKERRLKDAFVVIPLGDEAKTVTCPICKETLSSEFFYEEEEWVYKNAVDANGKIYHSTCYADASSTPNALISRIKQQLEQRSRSVTPDADSKRAVSLSPSSGILKRKTREENIDTNGAEEGTPPLKKVALTA